MNVSPFQKLLNKKEQMQISSVDNSSENTIEFKHDSENDYGDNLNNYQNKNALMDEKPLFNINTLQSLRISHSIENSKNSESSNDTISDNKINMNLNNEYKENNENDMNTNNFEKNKINEKININKNEENISRSINKTSFSYINNNKEINNIYDKIKIEEIFKERFEEKTRSYKTSNINKNLLKNDNNTNNFNNLNNKEIKVKSQPIEYLNNAQKFYKMNYIICTKNKNNKLNQLNLNDSLSLGQDSIESKENKNNNLILDTFDGEDKNILVSELEFDLSKFNQAKTYNNQDIKNKSKKKEKGIVNNQKKNKMQKKSKEKNKFIKKKIYPPKKINLNNNNSKKNIIQLKKRIDTEKNHNNLNINKIKYIHSSASTKFQRQNNQKNLDNLKQTLSNSNILSLYIRNTSTNKTNKTLYNKSTHNLTEKFCYKPKYSSKSIHNDKHTNLKKYYRLTPVNKININNYFYNDIKKVVIKNRNTNKSNRVLNKTSLNSNLNEDNNISNKNSSKKNNSFIIKRRNDIFNIINRFTKNFDIPINHCIKNISKNKIPYNKQKLYSNNNKIKNKINCFKNSIIRSNSYRSQKELNNNYLTNFDNNYNNYYDLLNNDINNKLINIYKNKNNNNKSTINKVYNSIINNIYSIPHKKNLSKNKSHITPKRPYLYDKKIINNKSKDNNLLTEYELNKEYKNLNYNKISQDKINTKSAINGKVNNKSFLRNISNNSLINNPFKMKENQNIYISTNNYPKTKLVFNKNKNSFSYRTNNNPKKNL